MMASSCKNMQFWLRKHLATLDLNQLFSVYEPMGIFVKILSERISEGFGNACCNQVNVILVLQDKIEISKKDCQFNKSYYCFIVLLHMYVVKCLHVLIFGAGGINRHWDWYIWRVVWEKSFMSFLRCNWVLESCLSGLLSLKWHKICPV